MTTSIRIFLLAISSIPALNADVVPEVDDSPQSRSSGCLTCATPAPCLTCVPQNQWGPWGPWSPCTLQYGVYSQTRNRTCLSGAGRCTGGNGGAEEAIRCTPTTTTTTTTTTTAPPQWSQWSEWGECSLSCGGGVQTRKRTCVTQCGTCTCQGVATEQRPCNTQSCCQWNPWGTWSECSVTCGSGLQLRTRGCTCAQCPSGEAVSQQACQMPSCPSCITCQPVTTPAPCITCIPPTTVPTIPCINCAQPSVTPSDQKVPVIGQDPPAVAGNNSVPVISSTAIPCINC